VQAFQGGEGTFIAGYKVDLNYEIDAFYDVGMGCRNAFDVSGKPSEREIRFDLELSVARRF
jgi:hypothetical protein